MTKKTFGKVMTFALLVVAALCTCWACVVFFAEDRGMVIRKLTDDASVLASTLFFSKMTAIAQLAIGLLGGAWAFLTLADTKVEVKSREVLICFTIANFMFALSLLVYAFGYDFIVTRVFHHKAFDIDAPFIQSVSSVQQVTFLFGCIALGATVLLGRKP